MFRLIWAASVRTRDILSYAPTNLLIAATRTRRGLRWGIPAMLLAIPYLLAAYWCVTTIEAGGPGWLNILVLLCAWNTIKLILNGPITLILLIRTRIQETAVRRRARRAEYERPHEYAEVQF
ncbi:sulfate permease [Brevibacterium casei]